MLRQEASCHKIEELFLREQYGMEVVVPSIWPLLPYMAMDDSRIIEQIRHLAPEIVREGRANRSEVETLQSFGVERELGLAASAFAQIARTLHENLLIRAHGGGTLRCCLDEASLLAEVDDPVLQVHMFCLVSAAAEADTHLDQSTDAAANQPAAAAAAATITFCTSGWCWPRRERMA